MTFISASGDFGVASQQYCLNPSGKEIQGGERFNPNYPATCPYVTSMGSTVVPPGKTVRPPP